MKGHINCFLSDRLENDIVALAIHVDEDNSDQDNERLTAVGFRPIAGAMILERKVQARSRSAFAQEEITLRRIAKLHNAANDP